MKIMNKVNFPLYWAAASNDTDNVYASSSGGIFYELCRHIIAKHGIIYGATEFSPCEVRHDEARDIEAVKPFRRSKYLRSAIGNCYARVKDNLEKGYLVLFSGAGCQIGGLYKYLSTEYDNLYTCEVVCHGAPLNVALKKYVSEQEEKRNAKMTKINFRDKREGWLKNCIAETYDDGSENVGLSVNHPVHGLYLRGINVERGCGTCGYQKIPRTADITLADFWQCNLPEFSERKSSGISLVSINTLKGANLFNQTRKNLTAVAVSEQEAVKSCRHLAHAPQTHPGRDAFEFLIKRNKFSFVYSLFTEFAAVILPKKLSVYRYGNEEDNFHNALKTLFGGIDEIAYFTDDDDRIVGIATFGEFINKSNSGEVWLNQQYKRAVFGDDCIPTIKKIFAENKKINRIPVTDAEGKLLFEVRRICTENNKNDYRKYKLVDVLLKRHNIRRVFVHRPDAINGFVYTLRQQVRMLDAISFPQILSDPSRYEKEYKDVLGTDCDGKYIENLGNITKIFFDGRRYRHADNVSQFVNIVGGERVTTKTLTASLNTMHVYGRCGVFGYAVKDEETLPSRLQYLLTRNHCNIKVINHGLWGADDEKIITNIYSDMTDGTITPNDMVLVYAYLPSAVNDASDANSFYMNTTVAFHKALKSNNGINFYDKPGHMNAAGYAVIAENIFCEIKDKFLSENNNRGKYTSQTAIRGKAETPMLREFIENCKKRLPNDIDRHSESIGAIVMNCNPFTLGHLYLIKKARETVDRLLIFVVEEDKSTFSFALRFEMVQEGCRDLPNVYILPSGKFMISALTFPEYFTKDENSDISINPTADVRMFAEHIAPAFHITKRFAGTEPTDKITAQYNETMSHILHNYGIEFVEIERLKNKNGFISATTVREYIEKCDYDSLRQLLPNTTIKILQKHNWIN